MNFLSLRVRTAIVVHGFDEKNEEIQQNIQEGPFVEKLIALSRIQSVSEKYILVTSYYGRAMYWEYEGGFEALKERLNANGLLVK